MTVREDERLRAQMIRGLNGHAVSPDTAWEIIHRWDTLVAERRRAERAERVVVAARRAWQDDRQFAVLVAALREYDRTALGKTAP